MSVVPTMNRARKLAIHIPASGPHNLTNLLDRQNCDGNAVCIREIAGGAIGCIGDCALPATGNICVFTGLPIRGSSLEDLTDADAAVRLLPTFDGAFAGVFWDTECRTLIVATDCLGFQPLYIRYEHSNLTLVSDTKAMPGEPDPAAWGAFILSGRPIAARSLVEGLHRVPPASILSFDAENHRLDIRRYWSWPEPSDCWREFDFLDALEQDMRAYAAFGEPGTLLLSGGFDSRLLLFLLKRAGIPATAHTVSHVDEHSDGDGHLAKLVARLADVPHLQTYPLHDFFSSLAYLDYLCASDVGSPSLDLFIAKVASQITSPAVWDGLIGPIFRAESHSQDGFDAYLKRRISDRDSPAAQSARRLFRPDFVESMFDGFANDLETEIARLPQNEYGMTRFMFENRIRNRPAINTVKVYGNKSNVYVPGVSKDFLAHALIIPHAEKCEAKFYRALFAQLDERALTIPVLSGGVLEKGTGTEFAYMAEWLRICALHFRDRHPSLFPESRFHKAPRSSFLCDRLLSDADDCINPWIRGELSGVDASNYDVWKLLFHWKAWRWVHAGTLYEMLGDLAH